jgi:peptide/nickel transport system permease protein
MLRYAARRLGGSCFAIVGVALAVFLVLRATPGDPVDNLLGEQASAAERQQLREFLGLDRPLGEQLMAYVSDVGRGTLGVSYRHREQTVASRIGRVLPWTLALASTAMLIALAIALPLGVIAALRAGTWVDATAMATALAGISIDKLWLGPMLLFVFYVQLGWLPGPADDPSLPGSLVLPALTLGAALAAMLSRMTRGTLLEALGEDYVRTARAKGLSPFVVVVKHALRNALVPIVTIAGLQFGALLSGAMITEKIFGRPGVGTLLLDAISERDYPVVQGCVLVIAACYVVVNLVTDLTYAVIDPRIRVS